MAEKKVVGMCRLFVNGKVIDQWPAVEEDDDLFVRMLEKHPGIADQPHMIEVELNEGPPNERFLRFGTDKTNMVEPIELDMQNLPPNLRPDERRTD